MKLDFDINQLKNLDFTDVGGWPLPAKAAAGVAVAVLVLALGFWFDTRPQLADLSQIRAKEDELKATFEKKNGVVANLKAYQTQMEEMKASFGTMVNQLPSKTEIEDLLADISQTGLNNDLEFDLFKPEQETPVEFYAELPIKIKVIGDYHDIGKFASDVSILPRIVTLHNLTIKKETTPAGKKEVGKKSGALTMEATAKTYRYMGEEKK